jgi:2-dehydropantoate 2-reductase
MRPMAEPLQFVVVGAGNLGCVYGGNLGRIGQKVAFIDVWKDHVDAIRARGLHLEGLTGDFTIQAHAGGDAREAPKADVVLVCVNSYSTAAAGRAAQAVLKPDGCCLTLQNGVGNVEVLTEILGSGRVLAGLSFQSGDIQGPGHVRHTNNGPTYLGELDRAKTPRLARLNELLASAGMNPVVVDDVMRTIWTKFIHNCGINAVCAITGLRPGHLRLVPELDEFQTRIIEETVALVRAKGIEPTEPDPVAAIKEYCSHKFHRPSMMQHLDHHKPTEIDSLNGYVARESRKLGLAAPYSDALMKLIKGREFVAPTEENAG